MFARVQGLLGYGNVHSKSTAANQTEKKQPAKTYSLRTVVASTIAGIVFGTIAERYQFKNYLAPIGTAIKNGVRTVCSFAAKNTSRICAAGVSAASAHPYIATAVGVAAVGGIFFGIRHFRKNAIRNDDLAVKPAQRDISEIESEKGSEKAVEKNDSEHPNDTETRKTHKSIAEEARETKKTMDSKPKATTESKSLAKSNESEVESENETTGSVREKAAKIEKKLSKPENKEIKNAASPESKSTDEAKEVDGEEAAGEEEEVDEGEEEREGAGTATASGEDNQSGLD